jgi:hypothetical protein
VNAPSERGGDDQDDKGESESKRSEAHMSMMSATTKRSSISSGHDSIGPLMKTITAYATPATGDKKAIKVTPGKIAVTTTTNFTPLTGAL